MNNPSKESIFQLHANYEPTGDQPKAISQINEWLEDGVENMTIHGITGSGKTFTMANIIAQNNRPALIYSPNKILAYQLYEELKAFFPNNEVHYYVSTFDYYIPEFVKYGEFHTKQSVGNELLESMSLNTAKALATNKRDVIVVASSSCLFGTGSPDVFRQSMIYLDLGNPDTKENILKVLGRAGYKYEVAERPNRGTYAITGNSIDIYTDIIDKTVRVVRLKFDPEDYLLSIQYFERDLGTKDYPMLMQPQSMDNITIFPATRFTQELFTPDEYEIIKQNMLAEARSQQNSLNPDYYDALVERIHDDIEQIMTTGYCNGIENYAWYMNRQNLHRKFQHQDYYEQQPFTIMSFFPQDTLVFIDESHLSLGQIKGAAFADFTRKKSLISHGIRLPSCVINRPLTKDEFQGKKFQTIHVSATPSKEELELSQEHVTNLFIRPTYLLDPEIEFVFVDQLEKKGIDYTKHVINQIMETKARGGAVLLRCPDGKVAFNYLQILRDYNIEAACMLAETPAPERRILVRRLQGENVEVIDEEQVRIQRELGEYDDNNPPKKQLKTLDVIIGVNLIREGLDIPRVEKVLIVYADRGGFLNDHTSLIQVMGRAARNQHGKVLIYLANETTITPQIQRAVDDTRARRELQMAYNREHGKTPKTTMSNSIITSLREAVEENYNEEFEGLFTNNSTQTRLFDQDKYQAELQNSLAELEKSINNEASLHPSVTTKHLQDNSNLEDLTDLTSLDDFFSDSSKSSLQRSTSEAKDQFRTKASSPVRSKPQKPLAQNITSAKEEELLASLLDDLISSDELAATSVTDKTTTVTGRTITKETNIDNTAIDNTTKNKTTKDNTSTNSGKNSNTKKQKTPTKGNDSLPDIESLFDQPADSKKITRKKNNPQRASQENIDDDLASILDEIFED